MNPSTVQNITAILPSALQSSSTFSPRNLRKRWSACTYTISKEAPFNSHPILSLTTQPCGLPVTPGVAAASPPLTQSPSGSTSSIGSRPSPGSNGPAPGTPTHSAGFAHWQLGVIIPVCIIVVAAVIGGLLYLSRKKASRKPGNREQQPGNEATGPNRPPEHLPLTRYNLQRHEQGGPGWRTLRTVGTFRWGHPPSTHRDDGQGLELRPIRATPVSRREPQPPPPPATERQPVEARAGTSPRPPQSPTRTPRGNRAGDNAEQVYVDMRQAQNVTVQIHGSDGAQRHARDDSGYASNLPPSPLRRSPERHARAELHGEQTSSPLRRSPERPARAELHSEPDFTTPLDFGMYRR